MDFITLADAAAHTGKTLITIRRLAKKPSSAPYVKTDKGKLYIDKEFVSNKYSPLSTQPDPELSIQTDQDLSTQSIQPEQDLNTHLLIDALREQYENRIQDLKEALKEKQLEVDRITTLFNQQQQIEMARVAKLPAKSDHYQEAETVQPEPTTVPPQQPIEQAPTQAIPEEPEPVKKRRWWPW